MPPRVVAFDLGKVLLDFDYQAAAARLADHADASPAAIYDCLMHSGLLHRFEYGRSTAAEFFAAFCAATGYRGGFDAFVPNLGRIFTPIEPMIRLQQELRAAGLRTWIFSNTNEVAVKFIREDYPFFAGFDGYLYSFIVHAMKPEPAIYDAFETTTGATGAEILYLDDRPENVAAGAARGWQAIVHEDPAKSIAQVKALLQT
jgi:FMN phosphatase YigB (HAD superfamily)